MKKNLLLMVLVALVALPTSMLAQKGDAKDAVDAVKDAVEEKDSLRAKWHPYAYKRRPVDRKDDHGRYAKGLNYEDRQAKKWSFGVSGGMTMFHGDADKKIPSWNVGPYVKWSLSQTVGLRASYRFGVLKGARDYQKPTLFKDDFTFKSNYEDMTVEMVFTLGNVSFLRPLRRLQYNLFVGAGQGMFRSKANFVDQRLFTGGDYQLDHYFGSGRANPNLGKAVEETYEGRHFILPFGIGMKYMLNRYLDLGLSYRHTYTRNDDIDVYNTRIWPNRHLDFYTNTNLSLAYKFGNKNIQHYDWLSPVESIYDKIDALAEDVRKLKLDSDGDGVADMFDTEVTPDSCMVYGNGQSVDTDRDGIPDCKDDEPVTISDCGIVDENGVAVDTDGDGVPDCRDKDINSKPGVQVDATGREIVMPEGNSCCNCDDMYMPSVHFNTASSNINPEYYAALFNIAKRMKDCPDKRIAIIGHADKRGGTKYNDRLSWKRSNAIIDYLVNKYGMSRERFIVKYSGESAPTAAGGSSSALKQNRRVEVRFASPGESGNNSEPAPSSRR